MHLPADTSTATIDNTSEQAKDQRGPEVVAPAAGSCGTTGWCACSTSRRPTEEALPTAVPDARRRTEYAALGEVSQLTQDAAAILTPIFADDPRRQRTRR